MGNSPSDDTTLLTQWAPQFVFAQDETHFPSSVDWYLERTALQDTTGKVIYSPVIDGNQRKDSSCLVDASLGERRQWTLNIIDPASRSGDVSMARCYAYVRPVLDENGNIVAKDLNYYIFYPFNGNIVDTTKLALLLGAISLVSAFTYFIPGIGPAIGVYVFGGISITSLVNLIKALDGVGMHEGDWEYVVVRVRPDGSAIQKVYFSAHSNEGEWTTSYQTTPDGHPIAYVARDSHANYTGAGTFARLWGVASDVTSAGQAWDTKGAITNVGYDQNAAAAMLWSTPTSTRFDGGADPAVTANSNEFAISVHRNNSTYYYNAGMISNNSITWWQTKGVKFDTGDNDPCVAMNEDGLIVSLHRSNDTKLYYNAGVIDPGNRTIAWWNSGHGTQYDSGKGDPAVAMNSEGVVLSVHEGGGLYYNVGMINAENKRIDWANNGRGIQYSQNGYNPVVAFNDRNEVVAMHTLSGKIYFSVGVYAPSSQTITWNVLSVQHDTGNSPQVALNNEGEVVEVHNMDGKLYYNVGEITDLADGKKTIDWATAAGVQYDEANKNQAVALLDDGTVIEVHRNNSDLLYRLGTLIVDSFDNWTPLNSQYWLKYSGRWGKKGTTPIVDIGDVTISNYEDGPVGPAYKGAWLGGPEE
jgi:Vacuolar protein sorting-associated protein 62